MIKLRILRWGEYCGVWGWPKVIKIVFIKAGGRQESQRRRFDDESRGWSDAKKGP